MNQEIPDTIRTIIDQNDYLLCQNRELSEELTAVKRGLNADEKAAIENEQLKSHIAYLERKLQEKQRSVNSLIESLKAIKEILDDWID